MFATSILALALVAGALLGSGKAPERPPRPDAAIVEAGAAHASMSRAAFHDAMRALWEDHITWTRLYIVSAAGNLPDLQATTARLMQNQSDIGNAIKPFYGDKAGDALTALLKGHIALAAQLVAAAKSGDTAAVRLASTRWYANADSIAAFLSAANPKHWPEATLRAGMHMHLDQTLEEAAAQLHGNYDESIAAYAKVETHILGLADVLSSGIAAEFPSKFN